jgi:copper(I)-binding protein
MKTILKTTATAILLALGASAWAQSAAVDVQGAWARATVQGQKATGAFMKLTAKENAKLVSASSPVAGVVEIHEMKMEENVMKMRAIPSLDLPAGKAVELKPGGYHVMLMDLKEPLKKETTVPITLVVKDDKGVESKVELTVPVSLKSPSGMGGMGHQHGHGHAH